MKGMQIMKTLSELKNTIGLKIEQTGNDGGCGKLYLCGTKSKPAIVVFSNGLGWEHVSVLNCPPKILCD